MVNRAMLIGRLGRDPELRYTPSGTAVANFSLATDERFRDNEGNNQSRTEWHNIVVWGKLGEICGRYLKKGRLVYIEGRIQTREWDDRDGNKRRTTEIVARDMQMLESRNAAESGAPGGGASPSHGEERESSMEIGISDDDIPF